MSTSGCTLWAVRTNALPTTHNPLGYNSRVRNAKLLLPVMALLLVPETRAANPELLDNPWSARWIAVPEAPAFDYGVYHFRFGGAGFPAGPDPAVFRKAEAGLRGHSSSQRENRRQPGFHEGEFIWHNQRRGLPAGVSKITF